MKKITLLLFIAALFLATSSLAIPDMAGVKEADAPAAKPPISGKALEVINSSGYTYLLIQDKDGFKDWVAIPELFVTVGDEVELQPGVQMGDFKSKPLNRTFEHIYFSSGPTDKYNESRKLNAHKGADMSAPAPGSKKTASKFIEGLKVDKAAGANAYTIAEVILKREELQDKTIAVRGQVVKVSTGIMGRNWVHLMDGSGEKGDNKLVITSKGDAPEVGALVTATGVFHNNVDFGGGYKYPVIMEEAVIK